jgi:spore maturation protein CgeB
VADQRGDAGRPRVAFLSNSWLQGDNWGPFQRSLIDLLAPAVAGLLVVRVNSFLYPWSDVAISRLEARRFSKLLEDYRPDLVFSINRAGLSGEVVRALPSTARLLTLFIDYYDRVPDSLKDFDRRDFVWGTGTGWLRDAFHEKYRRRLRPEQVEFTLWASDTNAFYDMGIERDLDIVFIASPLQQEPFSDLLTYINANHPGARDAFLDSYVAHRKHYIHDIVRELRRRGFATQTVSDQPYAAFLNDDWIMQTFMSDQISSEVRLKYLSALADFDLHLYGEPEALWIQFISMTNANLLRRYSFRPVTQQEELRSLYNRAKIGLNVQHHHASDAGLSMRVFDIMASGALLLTHRIAAAPLAELGYREDEHYAAFDGVEELRSQARSLLADDARRERLAAAGRELTHERHTLALRMAHVFERAGWPAIADTLRGGDGVPPHVRYVSDPESVELPPDEVKRLQDDVRRGRQHFPKQRFPRTPREARAAVGRMLPDLLVDVDRRLFRNWFLKVELVRDAGRGGRH